jgi:hypothetical protein
MFNLSAEKVFSITRIFIVLLLTSVLFPALLGAPPDGQYDWSNASKLKDGIRYVKLDETTPRLMKIYAVRVDSNNPEIYFHTSQCDVDLGKPMPDCPKYKITTKRQRTLDFFDQARAKGINMVLAVNASPWRPWEKPFNHKYSYISGFFAVDGKVIVPQMKPCPAFVMYKDGKMAICKCSAKNNNSNILFALPGFSIILKDGKYPVKGKNHTLHPRTFFGVAKDKRYVYFVVVDGRSPGHSEGINLQEGAAYLKYFGAYDAINMDGGGSTTLVFENPETGRGRQINTSPRKSKYTRPVANSIGVCLKNKSPRKRN